MYLVFSAFTSRPTSLTSVSELLCLSLWHSCYPRIDLHYQHRPEVGVSQSNLTQSGFIGPSG
jgi:hypothetical protein